MSRSLPKWKNNLPRRIIKKSLLGLVVGELLQGKTPYHHLSCYLNFRPYDHHSATLLPT